MDFVQQEATVVDIKSHQRRVKLGAGHAAVSLHPAGTKAFFKLEEAQQILPIIFKLTDPPFAGRSRKHFSAAFSSAAATFAARISLAAPSPADFRFPPPYGF